MYNERAEFFESLYREYEKRIYGYFRRRFDTQTALDLCQQTFLKAWQYLLSYGFHGIKNKKSWLFTVAKNTANDYLRYTKTHSGDFEYTLLSECERACQSDLEEQIAVSRALNELSEQDRTLLSMSQHFTSREIGSVLGISASAARTRLQKARQRLAELLEKQGISENNGGKHGK